MNYSLLRERASYTFRSVVMLAISLIVLLPFILMVTTSLKSSAEVNASVFQFFPEQLMWSNYMKALTAGDWGRYFLNSLYITIVVTAISLLINSMAGFAFARLDFPGKHVLFIVLLVGLLVPSQVIMVPVFIMMKHVPLFGGNDWLGRGGTGWINTYWGLMMPYLAGAFGTFLCRQFYLNFPKALDEAAEIDGCSKWRIYFQMYIPQSKPLLASLGVIKLSAVWNEYVWPLVITNSENMKTVQLALSNFKNEVIEWEVLMAATTMVVLPLIIVFLFANRYFVQGIATTGMKG